MPAFDRRFVHAEVFGDLVDGEQAFVA